MKRTLQPQTQQVLFETNGYLAEMCIGQESLEIAYHLRYRAYLHADAIEPNAHELCTDPFDEQENSRTFLIWYEGQPVASVRSLTWSADFQWQSTPSLEYFKEEVTEHLGINIPLLESNRYVVDPDFNGRKSLTAQMLLFRIQTLGSLADQCDYVITAVRPRHVRFYERFMNFYPISGVKSASEVKFPIQLLATPVSSREKLVQNSSLAAFEPEDLDRYKRCLDKLVVS